MRRRAFTLLELMVVMIIIASLAAIIFPIFARAKTQAKRAVDATQMKEIGMASVLYVQDYDDVYFPRKIIGPGGVGVTGAQAINPDYQTARATLGQTSADQLFGVKTRNVEFYSQILATYTTNKDIWKSSANPNAWVGVDTVGQTEDPAYRSYGGQNSFGLNLNLFSVDTPNGANGGVAEAQIEHPSDVYLLMSSNYYVVASRNGLDMPANQSLGASPVPFDACRAPFYTYWKNLGNSRWALWNANTSTFNSVPDTEVLNQVHARFNGFVLFMFADTHVRTVGWDAAHQQIASVPSDPNGIKVRSWDPTDDISTATACTAALPDNDPNGINR